MHEPLDNPRNSPRYMFAMKGTKFGDLSNQLDGEIWESVSNLSSISEVWSARYDTRNGRYYNSERAIRIFPDAMIWSFTLSIDKKHKWNSINYLKPNL